METALIVFTAILFLLSVGTFVLASLQFKEKGILLNNAYIWSSKEERSKMNKKPYYRQSAKAFVGIGIMFMLIAVEIITAWNWILFSIIGMSILLIIYAIVSSVNIEKKYKAGGK